eukprot:GGOE01036866.1.p1 GENE.GGOE01036866.1~~GGOE01036866.1.p1  ORF type:complete len:218 (+),score=56.77 GGOE01036866.1:24-656(+)
MDDDDDVPQLSAAALAALAEVYQERQSAPVEEDGVPYFPPDWGLAQFWYDKDTADLIATEAAEQAKGGRVACLCTPTLFRALAGRGYQEAFLFDVDSRFHAFGGHFVMYDLFEGVGQFDASLEGTFDCIVLDPPRINRDVLAKAAEHARWLSRSPNTATIAVTGAVLEEAVKDIFQARRTKWDPTHSCTIQNPFACYTNYPSARFQGWIE